MKPAASPEEREARLALGLRWLLVAAQGATIVLTWPLWQVRERPPLLPAVALPPVDMGPWLLGSLVVVLITPRIGIALHAAFLLLAMAMDQSRMQPQIVSHTILLCGTLPPLRMLARAHLIALWFYAGLWKALSAGFADGTAMFLLRGVVADATREQAAWFAVLIWATEMTVAVFLVPVRTRKIAAVAAMAMHGSILLLLSPLFLNYNSAVWPWNVSLAAAAFVFFYEWKEPVVASVVRAPVPLKAALLVLLLSPVGHYVGVVDAYLAHSLYSDHVPEAEISSPDGPPRNIVTEVYQATNAPLPPEHRLYDAYFARVAEPGDVMVVSDPRWWFRAESRRVVRATRGP